MRIVLCSWCGVGYVCRCGTCHNCNHNHTLGVPGECWSPKSQKVLGLIGLKTKLSGYFVGSQSLEIVEVLPATTEKLPTPLIYPYFARPCPLRPRHGFVESRIVTDDAELMEVIKETREADPEGEVMLTRFQKAKLNLVYTPHMLTIGAGHDGATAGKDTINFPLNGVLRVGIRPLLKELGVGTDEDPYIEAIQTANGVPWILTQLRAGPQLGGPLDFIPKQVVVKEVITVDPSSSLLAWEEKMQSAAPGTVVYHPGGSPADHFSVHARSFKIPILITREPVVGETLDALTTVQMDPHAVLKGVVAAGEFKLEHVSTSGGGTHDAVLLLLHCLHHSSAFSGEQGWWMGFGAGLMMRLGCTALRGEARHINRKGKTTREKVFERVLPHSLQRHRAALPRLINTLRYGNFGGGSVGGIKWAQCGEATCRMFNAVGELTREPNQENVGNLTRAFNFAVNQAHNGGWWLNKFYASQEIFNHVKAGFIQPLFNVIPMLIRAETAYLTLSKGVVSGTLKQWEKWTDVDLTPPKLKSVKLLALPGVGGLSFEVEDRLLKNKHKAIVVSTEKLVEKLPHILRGNIVARTTRKGFQLLFCPPHEKPSILWEEDGINEGKNVNVE